MKRLTIFLLMTLALAGGCASGGEEQEKSPRMQKNDAIDDFIKVSELEPESRIRYTGQLQHEVITDDYIFIRDNRNTWLIVFAQTCYHVDGPIVEPDVRYDSRTLRSRFDTIRGCRIRDIYPVTDGMVQEIEALIRPYE
ncbi:MAG: DUF6491 family protein [Pseudomonadota bacterium]